MAERIENPVSTGTAGPPATIKLLLLDVDGVLTDGGIYYDGTGRETKRFDVRDGLGIKAAMRAGIEVGIITARSSDATRRRAEELGIDILHQNVPDKLQVFANLCSQRGVLPSDAAYIGDDLADLGVLQACGYPMTVADAAAEIRSMARFITTRPGGHGAVREAIEHLLKRQGLWDRVVAGYRPLTPPPKD